METREFESKGSARAVNLTKSRVFAWVCAILVVLGVLAGYWFTSHNTVNVFPDNGNITTTDRELNLYKYNIDSDTAGNYTRDGLVFFIGLDPNGSAFSSQNGEIVTKTDVSVWAPGASTMSYMLAVMSDNAVKDGDKNYRYAWYSPASRTLRYAYEGADTENIYNQLIIDTSVAKGNTGTRLFYNNLKSGYDNATSGRTAWLKNNWRGLTVGKEAAAKSLWRGFAGTDGSQFSDNIRKYLGYTDNMKNNMNDTTKWTDEEKQLGYLTYIDLLMTIYASTPADSDARTYYGNMIDRYIAEGVVDGTSTPFNITIIPGFALPLPESASGDKAITAVMPTIDFWKYAYQISNTYDFANKTLAKGALGSGGTEINYYYDTKLKEMTVPNVTAMTNSVGYGSSQFPASLPIVNRCLENLFSKRYDITQKAFIATSSGGNALNDKLRWTVYQQTAANDNLVGIDYIPAMPSTITNGLNGADGSITGDFKLEWADNGSRYTIVSPNSTNIGDSIRFKVQMTCLPDELPAWKSLSQSFTNFKIVLKPERVYSATRDMTGDGMDNEKNLGAENYIPNTLSQDISSEVFYSLVSGNLIYTQLYDLSPVSQNIKMGEMLMYGYDLDVTLMWGRDATCSDGSVTVKMSGTEGGFSADRDEISLEKAVVDEHAVSAYREEEHANSITYYTEPTAYAEVKQGTVEFDGTGIDETYEAMAGTPSTEYLYFASGGSEFILEFQLSYMEGEKGVRWYHNKFYGTECEFKHQDQFKDIQAKGTAGGSTKDAVGTAVPNITILKETFVADENGIDYSTGGKEVDAQWYNGYIPDGASSYSVDLKGHDPCVGDNATGGANSIKDSNGLWASDPINDAHMADCAPITATWTGIIKNENPQQGSADANGDTTHIKNHDKGNIAPSEHGGYVGNPGEFNETDTKWNIDNYWKAINQALTWAKAYEATNNTFTVMKWADSDNFQRIWKIGDAQITVSFSGGISNMGSGARPAGTYTTANLATAKKDGTLANFGYNLSFTQGTANTVGTCTPAAPPDTPHSDDDGSEETPSKVSNVKDINYTITVTFPKSSNGMNRLTAHELCGTCCRHNMQAVEDTFTQYSQYDYAYFSACRVYKIHRSYVDGMEEITFSDYKEEPKSDAANNHYMASGPIENYTYFLSDKQTAVGDSGKVQDGKGAWYPHWQDARKVISSYEQSQLHNGTDTIVAAISQGDPNIWYNIAMMHNANPYDNQKNYAYEARNQWLERTGKAIDSDAKSTTAWPSGSGVLRSRMNVHAGRVAYTIMNSHLQEPTTYENSQTGGVSPSYTSLGGNNSDGVYGAKLSNGAPFDWNGLISVWGDPIGSRSIKCDGYGMYVNYAGPAGVDTKDLMSRTMGSKNPVQITANGHKKPTVTFKESENNYAGLLGNTSSGGLSPNGKNADIPNWSVGILFSNLNYTDDEFFMQTLSKPDDIHNTTVAIEGTIEQAGQYQNNDNSVVKTTPTNNTIDWYDYQSEEYQRFRFRRNQTNKIFIVSDYLILQTSTGDQPVMYHWKSQTKRAQQHYDYTAADVDPRQAGVDSFTSTSITLKDNFSDMWYNQHAGRVENTEDWYTATANGWGVNNIGQYQQVNVGGYTGEWDDPSNKYSETGLDIYQVDIEQERVDSIEGSYYEKPDLVTRRVDGFETIFDRNGDLTDKNNVDKFTGLLLRATDGLGWGEKWPNYLNGKWDVDCYGSADVNHIGYMYGFDPTGAETGYTYSSWGGSGVGCWHWGSIVDSGARDAYKASVNLRLDAEYHSPGNGNAGSGESRMSVVGGLRLVTDMIEQDPTNPNGEYETGDAYQTYINILDWPLLDDGELRDGLGREYAYVKGWERDTEMNKMLQVGLIRPMAQRYYDEDVDVIDSDHTTNNDHRIDQQAGYIIDANYSDDHSKVNDIVVHNPVSVQNALVLHNATADENGWYSDTRTTEIDTFTGASLDEKLEELDVCPGDETCEFKVLNCKYFDDVTFVSLNFEPVSEDQPNVTRNLAYDLEDGHQDEKQEYFDAGDFDIVYQYHSKTPISDNPDTEEDESKDENGNQAFNEEWTKPFGTNAGYFLQGPGDDVPGAKMSIPLSSLGLSSTNFQNYKLEISFDIYQDSYLKEEPEGSGNIVARPSTMFFGFNTFGFFTPKGEDDPDYAFSSGNGLDKYTGVFDFYGQVNNVKIEMDFAEEDAVLKSIHFYLNGKEVKSDLWSNGTIAPITAESLFGNGSTLNIGCWNGNNDYVARFSMDNLVIKRKTGSTEHTDACYKYEKVYNTGEQYLCSIPRVWETTHNYEGEVNGKFVGDARPYIFTVPSTGKYRIQAWGASGGGTAGGKGGFASGFVNLTKGEKLLVYPGGKGAQAPAGGPDVEYLWGIAKGCGHESAFIAGADGPSVLVSSVVSGPVEYKNSVTGAVAAASAYGIWSKTNPNPGACGNHSFSMLFYNGKPITRTTSGTAPSSSYSYSRQFNYTGNVQSWTCPQSGTYKLEVWGAQGGGGPLTVTGSDGSLSSGPSHGGAGGYASGYKYFNKGETIYIYVGGQGSASTALGTGGGYNGGGQGGPNGFGGGGMTHMSTVSTDKIVTSVNPGGTAPITSGTKTYTDCPEMGWMCTDGQYHTVVFDPGQTSDITLNATHLYRVGYHKSSCSYGGTEYVKNNWGHLYDVTAGKCLSCSHSCSINWSYGYWTVNLNATQINARGDAGFYTTTPATDTSTVNFNTSAALIVAGGGGGADNLGGVTGSDDDGSGGAGGGTTGGNALINGVESAGTGATQTSGFKRGAGQSVTTKTDTGGAGGGWYGGKVTNNNNGGAGGGSGYVSTQLTKTSMSTGANTGNGKAKITYYAGEFTDTWSGAGFNGGGIAMSDGTNRGYGGGGASDVRRLGTSGGGMYVLDDGSGMTQTSADGLSVIEYNGAKYLRVFEHNSLTGGFFASDSQALNCNTTGKYSILNKLDQYKTGSKYQFMLYYPNTGIRTIWKQSTNPVNTQLTSTSTGTEKVPGYEFISGTQYSYFGGLAKSTSTTATLLDTDVSHGNWYGAIGAKQAWPTDSPTTFPGLQGAGESRVILYMLISEDTASGIVPDESADNLGELKMLESGTLTYGPYITAAAGTWQVDIYGKGLSSCTFDVFSNADGGVIYTDSQLINKKVSDYHVEFYFTTSKAYSAGGSGLEVRINHSNSAGYKFEALYLSRLNDRMIVAGGGGGQGNTTSGAGGNGGDGGTGGRALVNGIRVTGAALTDKLANTINSIKNSEGRWNAIEGIASSGCGLPGGSLGYGYGYGENASYPTGTGGAGGGWYGGYVTNASNGGAGGGTSGYNSGVMIDTDFRAGQNSGNGKVIIELTEHTFSDGYSQSFGFLKQNGSQSQTGHVAVAGQVQEWICPETGTYKLEVWGAAGGEAHQVNGTAMTKDKGGYGGYSSVTADIEKGTKLYIYVGGKGNDNTETAAGTYGAGGWNGGGNGGTKNTEDNPESGGGGGGATHISLSANDTITASHPNVNRDNLIVIAGGGGGAHNYAYNSISEAYGGMGGGVNGHSYNSYSKAGTQSSGSGSGKSLGMSGWTPTGNDPNNRDGTGGNGGGWYGGGRSTTTEPNADRYGGAGGSGYQNTGLSKGGVSNVVANENIGYGGAMPAPKPGGTQSIGGYYNDSSNRVYGNRNSNTVTHGNGYARITRVVTGHNADCEVAEVTSFTSDGRPVNIHTHTIACINSPLQGYYNNGTTEVDLKSTWSGHLAEINQAISEHISGDKRAMRLMLGTTVYNKYAGVINNYNGKAEEFIKLLTATDLKNIPEGSELFMCNNYPLNDSDGTYTTIKTLDCHEPHHTGGHYESVEQAAEATGLPVTDVDDCYDPCMNDANHNNNSAGAIVEGTTVAGAFYINTDEYFDLYFPTTGDFYESDDLGISHTQQRKGVGYTDDMDTKEWIRERYVKFDFDVLFYRTETGLWEQYNANEWIELPVKNGHDDYYSAGGEKFKVNYKGDQFEHGTRLVRDENGNTFTADAEDFYSFYCTLNNNEKGAAKVTFEAEAINAPGGEGKYLPRDKYPVKNISYSITSKVDDGTGDKITNVFKSPSQTISEKLFNMTTSQKWYDTHECNIPSHDDEYHLGEIFWNMYRYERQYYWNDGYGQANYGDTPMMTWSNENEASEWRKLSIDPDDLKKDLEHSWVGNKEGKAVYWGNDLIVAGPSKKLLIREENRYNRVYGARKDTDTDDNPATDHRNNNDNVTSTTNADRKSSLSALHGAHKEQEVDLVGRIGNFFITGTTDVRWANFFKVPDDSGVYLINGIVKQVDESEQRNYLSWHLNTGATNAERLAQDVRNRWVGRTEEGDAGFNWLYDTWKSQYWKSVRQGDQIFTGANDSGAVQDDGYLTQEPNRTTKLQYGPFTTPLSQDKNNLQVYRDIEVLRPGYTVNYEITTTGNYTNTLRIKPYFHALSLSDENDYPKGTLIPVDVYMLTDENYQPINLWGAEDINSFAEDRDNNAETIKRDSTEKAFELLKELRDEKGTDILQGLTDAELRELIDIAYRVDREQTEELDYADLDFLGTVTQEQMDEAFYLAKNSIDESFRKFPIGADTKVYDYILDLDWEKEKESRMITDREEQLTQLVHNSIYEMVENGNLNDDTSYELTKVRIPDGDYFSLGNLQLQNVTNQARTFIGQSLTSYEKFVYERGNTVSSNENDLADTNFDEKFELEDYAYRAQRWHLKLGLPSSAVFVPYNREGVSTDDTNRILPTDEISTITGNGDGSDWNDWDESHPGIEGGDTVTAKPGNEGDNAATGGNAEKALAMDVIKNGDYAIVMTANIKALGPIWNLYYGQYSTLDGTMTDSGVRKSTLGNTRGDNGSVKLNGTTYKFDVDSFLEMTENGDTSDRSNAQTIIAIYGNAENSEVDVDLIGTH